MLAKGARSRGVRDGDLRALLEREYLPRISVIVVPSSGSGHWMPSADDVPGPDDVEHVQVARFISARAVYSHDKDLRGPGFAPATRAAYDERVAHLAAVAAFRQLEIGVSVLIPLEDGDE
ncbi:hypothetical protein [Allobranchiibius sp. CTAmp26]|uniref:hypothetical protein n=1 Tax=Allobranchiibius sp. CTAmp26 TaxID=2815214 RepID=UPI001AA16059|nr:hypothetical protein [Allobranchiibius sp. CTAmp26]MBO1756534.1 hypothetical protein [Allobranchiibius sp. CTAmp26]